MDADAPGTCEGVLEKRSPHAVLGFRPWQERYFVLSHTTLSYYPSGADYAKGKNCKGEFPLDLIRNVYVVQDEESAGRSFNVELEGTERMFELRAHTVADADRWVQLLWGERQHLAQVRSPMVSAKILYDAKVASGGLGGANEKFWKTDDADEPQQRPAAATAAVMSFSAISQPAVEDDGDSFFVETGQPVPEFHHIPPVVVSDEGNSAASDASKSNANDQSAETEEVRPTPPRRNLSISLARGSNSNNMLRPVSGGRAADDILDSIVTTIPIMIDDSFDAQPMESALPLALFTSGTPTSMPVTPSVAVTSDAVDVDISEIVSPTYGVRAPSSLRRRTESPSDLSAFTEPSPAVKSFSSPWENDIADSPAPIINRRVPSQSFELPDLDAEVEVETPATPIPLPSPQSATPLGSAPAVSSSIEGELRRMLRSVTSPLISPPPPSKRSKSPRPNTDGVCHWYALRDDAMFYAKTASMAAHAPLGFLLVEEMDDIRHDAERNMFSFRYQNEIWELSPVSAQFPVASEWSKLLLSIQEVRCPEKFRQAVAKAAAAEAPTTPISVDKHTAEKPSVEKQQPSASKLGQLSENIFRKASPLSVSETAKKPHSEIVSPMDDSHSPEYWMRRASTAGYSDAPPAFNSTDDQHTASSLFGCCFPSKAPLAMSIRERAEAAEAAETAESSKKCVIL